MIQRRDSTDLGDSLSTGGAGSAPDANFEGVPRELPERQRVHARLFMDAPFMDAKATPFMDAKALGIEAKAP